MSGAQCIGLVLQDPRCVLCMLLFWADRSRQTLPMDKRTSARLADADKVCPQALESRWAQRATAGSGASDWVVEKQEVEMCLRAIRRNVTLQGTRVGRLTNPSKLRATTFGCGGSG